MITVSFRSLAGWSLALLTALVLFLFLGPVSPQADASGVGDVKKLARRVLKLERQVDSLQAQNEKLKIATFPGRLGALEDKAQHLEQDGTYYGYVNSEQIWSHYCADGESALWADYDGYVELTCPSGGQATPEIAEGVHPSE